MFLNVATISDLAVVQSSNAVEWKDLSQRVWECIKPKVYAIDIALVPTSYLRTAVGTFNGGSGEREHIVNQIAWYTLATLAEVTRLSLYAGIYEKLQSFPGF